MEADLSCRKEIGELLRAGLCKMDASCASGSDAPEPSAVAAPGVHAVHGVFSIVILGFLLSPASSRVVSSVMINN